jgi:predicted enzyme related to lactoylglutathione lyase
VVHFEIGCRDSEKTQAFYARLFGWEMQPAQHSAMVNTGSTHGIQGHITALGHEPHNYVNMYVLADDLEATLAKVEELGGTVMIPVTEVPDQGWFAWFKDIEGTMMGLWKPKMD